MFNSVVIIIILPLHSFVTLVYVVCHHVMSPFFFDDDDDDDERHQCILSYIHSHLLQHNQLTHLANGQRPTSTSEAPKHPFGRVDDSAHTQCTG